MPVAVDTAESIVVGVIVLGLPVVALLGARVSVVARHAAAWLVIVVAAVVSSQGIVLVAWLEAVAVDADALLVLAVVAVIDAVDRPVVVVAGVGFEDDAVDAMQNSYLSYIST